MGRYKQEMLGILAMDIARYEELKEMDLNNRLSELDKEIQDKKDEIECESEYDEDESKEDLRARLDNINQFKEELEELVFEKRDVKDLISELGNLKKSLGCE